MEENKNNNPTPTEVVDAVLSKSQDPKFDVNNDGKVDIQDVTAAIDNELAEHGHSPVNKNKFTVKGVTFEMVDVDGGTFMMGALNTSPDTSTSCKPQHDVTLSDYKIGKTEVTQELWEAVMGSNPSLHKEPQCPVEYVSWDQCQEFIAKLNELTGKNFRLPTEAEWEYAAKGGKDGNHDDRFSGSNVLNEVGWNVANSGGNTHPVAQLKENELGIYDMTGNVREWCQDWYAPYKKDALTNPTGPASGSFKVYRGGSYETNYKQCFTTYRYMRETSFREGYLGLRLAL